jgi:Tfp pilus assembly protein PilF
MNLAQSFQQAQSAFNGGDLWTASRVCDDMIKRVPGHPDVLHLMALVCKRQGHVSKAEKYFKASLRSKPRQPAVLSNLGNLLKRNRRYPEADEAYARALKYQPDLSDAWYNRGLMALEQGRTGKAIEFLESARRLDSRVNIELALIKAYQQADRLDEAIELADELRLRHPEDIRASVIAASARTSPEAYATGAGEWRARGAAVIGGCCGTTPAHIAALSARIGAKSGAQ